MKCGQNSVPPFVTGFVSTRLYGSVSCCIFSAHSVYRLGYRLEVGGIVVGFSGSPIDLSFCLIVQIISGAHPAYCLMANGRSCQGGGGLRWAGRYHEKHLSPDIGVIDE